MTTRNNSTHTPGPWKAWRRNPQSDTYIYQEHDDPHDTYAIACINQNWAVYGANARLIAAAPEMLEALKLVLPLLEGINSRCTNDTAMIKTIRSTISKAEGRS